MCASSDAAPSPADPTRGENTTRLPPALLAEVPPPAAELLSAERIATCAAGGSVESAGGRRAATAGLATVAAADRPGRAVRCNCPARQSAPACPARLAGRTARTPRPGAAARRRCSAVCPPGVVAAAAFVAFAPRARGLRSVIEPRSAVTRHLPVHSAGWLAGQMTACSWPRWGRGRTGPRCAATGEAVATQPARCSSARAPSRAPLRRLTSETRRRTPTSGAGRRSRAPIPCRRR